jgi:hypothetical protein
VKSIEVNQHFEGTYHPYSGSACHLSSCYTAILQEESEDQQKKAGPENMPKLPPIYITDIQNISPLTAARENSKTAI